MWSIRVLSGQQSGQIFDLKLGKNVFGRGGQSDFKVQSIGISKEHCEIHVYKDKMMIVDLKSSNGTFVNGVKIQNSLVQVGDKVSLFDVIMDIIPTPDLRPKNNVKALESRAAQSARAMPAQQNYPMQHMQSGNAAHQLNPVSPTYLQQMNSGYPQQNPQAFATPLHAVPSQEQKPPQLSISEKVDQYIENVAMPAIYKLAIIFSFKQVLMGFVIIFVFGVSIISLFPMTSIIKESNLLEAAKRAKSVARAMAKINEQALLSGQLGNLITQEAMKEDGIREAFIVQQSDGLIVAPSDKAGRDPGSLFILQARKESRATFGKVDSNTIGASHPIGVYDPVSGEPVVKYHAIVIYDVSSLSMDQERIVSLLMQTLVIASILGLMLYYLFARLIEYPIRSLNKQIDQALLDKTDRTEVAYDYPSFQKLVSNVNTLLNRVWTGGDLNSKHLGSQQNRDIEYSNLVEIISHPAFVIAADNNRVVALNSNFEQLAQTSKDVIMNQNYQSLNDSALVQNIDSLLARSKSSPYEKQFDRIPFSQFECDIYCQAFLNTSGEPEYFVMTLVKTDSN